MSVVMRSVHHIGWLSLMHRRVIVHLLSALSVDGAVSGGPLCLRSTPSGLLNLSPQSLPSENNLDL